MTRRTAGLRADLAAVRRAIESLAPGSRLVIIENSPDGMGDDEGLVNGVSYWRSEGETVGAFRDRLVEIATKAGAMLAFTGEGPSKPWRPKRSGGAQFH
ncbi:MAG TPA: hypothetical protein VFE60_17645 [Roseiarcus sp.]|jgi:hypothetical protein|nr:hypothetical protein [Roseiarcus sp.]